MKRLLRPEMVSAIKMTYDRVAYGAHNEDEAAEDYCGELEAFLDKVESNASDEEVIQFAKDMCMTWFLTYERDLVQHAN